MDLNHISGCAVVQGPQKAVIPSGPRTRWAFSSCRLCGDCCRHVRDRIMLEPLDAYNLGRYLA